MTQAVEVDAVPVVRVGHVRHGVTRVPASPCHVTRVQTLTRAVSPKLDGSTVIMENISVM